MLGVALSFYKEPLKRVPAHLNKKPADTLDIENLVDRKEYNNYVEYYGDVRANLAGQAYRLPLRLFKKASFDALCKIRASTIMMMDQSVEKLFENNLQYGLFHKITSSMWRWGHNKGRWNDIVDFYDCLRAFKLDRPEFTVRLDYTTYVNERGNSKHTSTYLDGPLAFIVYYKGKHVMTIGFAIMANRRILIQQVQLKEPKGNRWLYKLPQNYLAYVVDQFFANFPRHCFFIVSGKDLSRSYLQEYRRAQETNTDNIEWARGFARRNPEGHSTLASYIKDKERIEAKIVSLTADADRLTRFYSNTGHYLKNEKPLVVNGLTFYRLEPPKLTDDKNSSMLVAGEIKRELVQGRPQLCG